MTLAALTLLPAALVLDRLFGEPPVCAHPVCLMGALAARVEGRLRRGPGNARMYASGVLACLLVVMPPAALAGGLALAAKAFGGPAAQWLVSALAVYACLAPRSLGEHALRVARPLAAKDLEGARGAVAMIVGRNTAGLDAHGVARACVESIGENLVDGVLGTLFWAGVGLFLFGPAGAACLAVLHRAVNMLDALWGKKNDAYLWFGAFAARLDDALNFLPARLSLPCIACAAWLTPGLQHRQSLRTGWKYRAAHASPNSAWGEAAFAGALGLKLGGPAVYGGRVVDHPWLGDGTPDATPGHISLAVGLMYRSAIVFTVFWTLITGF